MKKHSRGRIIITWALVLVLALFSCANAAVRGYQEQLAAMSDSELLALQEDLNAELEERGLISASSLLNGEASGQTKKASISVWVSKSGKKYHSKSTCSKMKNAWTVDLQAAKDSGKTPCNKCNPPN